MRAPYEQFSESRSGGAFTFTTGAGGFLQEFLYGYTGCAGAATASTLDPSLPPQLTGVTLGAVHWRGRTLRVAIRRDGTDVTLLSGAPVTVESPAGPRARHRRDAALATRRPDTAPTDDVARCRPRGPRRPPPSRPRPRSTAAS